MTVGAFRILRLYKAGNISFQDIDVDAGQAMAMGGGKRWKVGPEGLPKNQSSSLFQLYINGRWPVGRAFHISRRGMRDHPCFCLFGTLEGSLCYGSVVRGRSGRSLEWNMG